MNESMNRSLPTMLLQRGLLPLAALLVVFAGSAAQATDAPAAAPGDQDMDKITVTGSRRTNERMRLMLDFVNKLSGPVDSSFGYARLEEAPCFLVESIAPSEVQYLRERLTVAAQEAGLAAPKPDCIPNISIFFTNDGKALADYIVKNHQTAVKPFGNAEGTTKDSHALLDFRTSEAPIRWWQITMPVDWSGTNTIDAFDPDSRLTVQGTESRITRPVRDRLLHTMIIVDFKKVGDATWAQLADYLAMVALVQVKPHTNLAGYDSILNLFDGSAKSVPPALSDWDKAYLHGVYAVNRYLQPWSQARALAGQVLDNLYK